MVIVNLPRFLLKCLCLLVALQLDFSLVGLAEEKLPTIKEPIIIKKWRIIGPFPLGVREAGTDPLAYFGEPPFDNPLLQGNFPSYLAPGAEVRWDYAFSDENGKVAISFPNIPEKNWELISDEWGFTGTLYLGYAYGSFVVDSETPVYALVDLEGAGSFKLGEDSLFLEGVPWPGDSYGHNIWKQPVMLKPGRNEVRVGFTYRGSFSFKVLPVYEPLQVIDNDLTIPDISPASPSQLLVGIPFVNCTKDWIQVRAFKLLSEDVFTGINYEEFDIPPFSVVKKPLTLFLDLEAAQRLQGETYELPVRAVHSLGEKDFKLSFRVRRLGESRKETYLSYIDGSVQYYAILEPKNYDEEKSYGLILSLHGAGVEAEGLPDNYVPKDWAFVVAPTNRRRFGFDWQDWGRLDTLQVVEEVKKRYRIDENRIHLTGHSMGGHGTWYLGLTYPDHWASAAPSAGWTTFPLYVPTFLRKDATLGHPKAKYLWELGMREDNTLLLVENALNLPFYALEGGADDNVPPQQPRMLVDLFRRYGYRIKYDEIPGQGHWWDATPDIAGTDCVDWPAFNKFWENTIRNPLPKRVIFRTHNYSINDSAYWAKVVYPEKAYEDIRVDAEVIGMRLVRVVTSNVGALRLHLPPKLIGEVGSSPETQSHSTGRITLEIDKTILNLPPSQDDFYFFMKAEDGNWQAVKAFDLKQHYPKKRPDVYGPWKQAFMKPFVIVYGTKGSEEDTFWNLHLARYYAQAWWYRANGSANIVSDTKLSDFELKSHNLILIGNARTNEVIASLEPSLPIKLLDNGVQVGNRFIFGKHLTVKFVYPNPVNGDNLILVLSGQDAEGFKRLFGFIEMYSGSGFPDFAIFGDEVKLQALAGALAMGFFNLKWDFDDSLTFFNEELISKYSAR